MRSSVSPLSNGMVLSQFDLIDSLHAPLLGDMPFRTLGPFLHESTHFWCNNSPVGIVLAALEMRAMRSAFDLACRFDLDPNSTAPLPTEIGDTDEYWQLVDDVVRLETTKRMLRPVSEGLALFMEHNAFLGDSQVLSEPMALALPLYRGREGTFDESALKVALVNGRLAPSSVRRKAALLLEPFSCEPTGYLPGYMFVKNAHRIAAHRAPKLADSELFVHVMKSGFYDNWSLVAAILDPSTKDCFAVKAITNSIQGRIVELMNLSDGMVASFEERGLTGEVDSFVYQSKQLGFHRNVYPVFRDDDPGQGKDLLRTLLDSLFGESGEPHKLARLNLCVLGLRDVLALGEAVFSGSVSSGNMLQFRQSHNDKFPLLSHGNSTRLEPGWVGEVEIGAFLTLRPNPALYFAYRVEDEILSCQSTKGEEAPDQMQTPLLFRAARDPLLDSLKSFVDFLLRNDPVCTVTNKAIESYLDPVFLPRALLAADEDLDSVIHQLRDEGFLKLLDGDADLLFALAVMSSAAAMRADRSWLEHLIQDDLDQIVATLNERLRRVCGGKNAIIMDKECVLFSNI